MTVPARFGRRYFIPPDTIGRSIAVRRQLAMAIVVIGGGHNTELINKLITSTTN